MTEALAKKDTFQPLAPIGSAGNLKSMLERNQESLLALLPKHVTPERLIKTMLVAANRNPDILKCTQSSVIETIQRAGELGLDLSGTLGEAYGVPFNNKIKVDGQEKFVMQLTLIPGYRGLAKLARQSGMVARLESEAVCENDHFIYRKGSQFLLEFEPNLTGERGKLRGFYAYAKLSDGSEQAEYMPVAEVEKIRQRAKSKDSPAWRENFSEMGRKTVFRRLAKWLPLSSEKWQAAMAQDDADYEEEPVIDVAPRKRGAQGLVDRLVHKVEPQEPAGEPEPAADAPVIEVGGTSEPIPHKSPVPKEAWDEVRAMRDGRKRVASAEEWARVMEVGKAQGWSEDAVEKEIERELGSIDSFHTGMTDKILAIFASFGAK